MPAFHLGSLVPRLPPVSSLKCWDIERIGKLHDDDILLQLPEFISVLLCYLNLSIPLRIKEQLSLNFAQENNKLKDSGSCTKMTSTCNCPIGDEIISATRKLQIVVSVIIITEILLSYPPVFIYFVRNWNIWNEPYFELQTLEIWKWTRASQ